MKATAKSTTKRLTGKYITGLSILGVLAKISQSLVQNALKKQQQDASLINMAGRQRMLSQKIVKLCFLAQRESDKYEAQNELQKIIHEWNYYHETLKKYRFEQGIFQNNKKVGRLFRDIEPYFKDINNIAVAFSGKKNISDSGKYYERLLKSERQYLYIMEEIVNQFDKKAVKKVNLTQKLDNALFITTIGVLVAEAWFIFRPAVRYIGESIRSLENKNRELERMNERLNNTKQELLEEKEKKHVSEINNQKIKTTYLITGQERERERISREVHDGLGQMLTASKLKIEKLLKQEHYSENEMKELQDLKKSFSEILDEARLISFNLMPTVLNDFGISAAVKMLVKFSENSVDFKIHFYQNVDEKRFNHNIEITLYRVVQECLNNAVKYAQCNNFYIDLFLRKGLIQLSISDDGKGFDYESFKSKNKSLTFGLNNVAERAHLLNGRCEIESSPGEGTKVYVQIPETKEKVNGNF